MRSARRAAWRAASGNSWRTRPTRAGFDRGLITNRRGRYALHIHKNGYGVAGVYGRDVAETRAAKAEALARAHEFPLRCSVEEEEV